jgi:hypothetical protein
MVHCIWKKEMKLSIALYALIGCAAAYTEPLYATSEMKSFNTAEACSLDGVRNRMKAPLTAFSDERKAANRPNCFDWCSDGCSAGSFDWWPENGPSGPKPGDVHLGLACARHDFAYRNLKLFKNFTKEMKNEADETLKKDMRELCEGSGHKFCPVLAPLYEWAVEKYKGGKQEYQADCKCTVLPGCCKDHSLEKKGCNGDREQTCSPGCRK